MTHLQEELNVLKSNLSEMAFLVESQLKKSIMSLLEEDVNLANEVLQTEKQVNSYELKIDKVCENIFTLLTPVAHDMRFVFATLKINSDLERIGDYAESIAKMVLHSKQSFDKELINSLKIKYMFEVSDAMLLDIITAYKEEDSQLASSVFSRDVLLNNIYLEAVQITIDYCQASPDRIEPSIRLFSLIQKLERVGDHITNIAEEIIFFKEARVLKHGNKGGEETVEDN